MKTGWGLDGLLTGRQWHRRRRGALGAPSRRARRRGRRRSRRRIRRLSAVLAGRWSRLGRRLGCWGLCCLERCFFERGVLEGRGIGMFRLWVVVMEWKSWCCDSALTWSRRCGLYVGVGKKNVVGVARSIQRLWSAHFCLGSSPYRCQREYIWRTTCACSSLLLHGPSSWTSSAPATLPLLLPRADPRTC